MLDDQGPEALSRLLEGAARTGIRHWLISRSVPTRGSDAGGLGLDALRARASELAGLAQRAAALGIQVQLSGIPDCVLGVELADRCRAERALELAHLPAANAVIDVGFREDGSATAGAAWGRERTEPCRRCTRDLCTGFDATWLDRHGTSGLRPFLADPPSERRLHVYGVGIAKTGSTSLARMFTGYRNRHEHGFVEAVARQAEGQAGLDDWLVHRDRAERLEVECSTFLYPWAGALARLFPDARFLCAVREPADQVQSFLNMMLRQFERYDDTPFPTWKLQYGRLLYGGFDPAHFASEASIRAALPQILDGYLGHWAQAHRHLLDDVPPDRILFFPASDLSRSAPRIADFLGLDADSLAVVHANQAPEPRALLDSVVELDSRVQQICGPVQAKLRARRRPASRPGARAH